MTKEASNASRDDSSAGLLLPYSLCAYIVPYMHACSPQLIVWAGLVNFLLLHVQGKKKLNNNAMELPRGKQHSICCFQIHYGTR